MPTKTTHKPKPPLLTVRLPADSDRGEINTALAQIAGDNGFRSHNAPKQGSIGRMLFAIATGRAMVVNLDRNDE